MLLDYVRYPHNPLIQAEAVRIAQFLAARIPNLVDLLLLPGKFLSIGTTDQPKR